MSIRAEHKEKAEQRCQTKRQGQKYGVWLSVMSARSLLGKEDFIPDFLQISVLMKIGVPHGNALNSRKIFPTDVHVLFPSAFWIFRDNVKLRDNEDKV